MFSKKKKNKNELLSKKKNKKDEEEFKFIEDFSNDYVASMEEVRIEELKRLITLSQERIINSVKAGDNYCVICRIPSGDKGTRNFELYKKEYPNFYDKDISFASRLSEQEIVASVYLLDYLKYFLDKGFRLIIDRFYRDDEIKSIESFIERMKNRCGDSMEIFVLW